jgi:hypothetical protein
MVEGHGISCLLSRLVELTHSTPVAFSAVAAVVMKEVLVPLTAGMASPPYCRRLPGKVP